MADLLTFLAILHGQAVVLGAVISQGYGPTSAGSLDNRYVPPRLEGSVGRARGFYGKIQDRKGGPFGYGPRWVYSWPRAPAGRAFGHLYLWTHIAGGP